MTDTLTNLSRAREHLQHAREYLKAAKADGVDVEWSLNAIHDTLSDIAGLTEREQERADEAEMDRQTYDTEVAMVLRAAGEDSRAMAQAA